MFSVYLQFFLVTLITGLTSSIPTNLNESTEVKCGINIIKRGKILGGYEALEGEFPWLVSIRFEASKTEIHHICGGALLNSRFVLTVAHCMHNKNFKFMSVAAGEHDLKEISTKEQIRRIENVFLHKEYGTKDYINDIALVELTEPVAWTTYVRPICLPNSNDDEGNISLDNQIMQVAGWGSSKENLIDRDKIKVLQITFVPIVNLETCLNWYELGTSKAPGDPQHVNLSKNGHLCAGYEEGRRDFCSGDSGGPLMKTDETGRKVAVGVASAGIGCGRPKSPGIYTRIVNYIPWIQSILSSKGLSLQ